MTLNPLKFIVLFSMSLVGLTSCQPESPTDLIEGEIVADIVFEGSQEKIPSNVMIDEPYFEETGHVFLLNQDYARNYSEVVEYDTESMEAVDFLYSVEIEDGFIYEFDVDDGSLVWSTVLISEGKVGLYHYDIESGALNELPSELLFEGGSPFPTSVSVDGDRVAWVENDMENELSKVVVFDLVDQKKEVVVEAPFTDQNFKVATFFALLEEGQLFYDLSENGEVHVYAKNLEENGYPERLKIDASPILHFSGDFDPIHQTLVLYAVTEDGDVIYEYNLEDQSTQTFVGFYENSLLFKDKLWVDDHRVYYSVQQNVSGPIADHYFAEVYDLETMTSKRQDQYFSVFKSDHYFAGLIFEGGSTNDIRFELFEMD